MFDLESVDEFKAGLKSNYNITDNQPAPFINTRSSQTSVFIITFLQRRLPYSIYIPGERHHTRVFEFRDKPLKCANCQQHGHAKKYCKHQEPTCRKCAEGEHSLEQCCRDVVKGLHCGEEHMAGNQECAKYQREETLIRIQGEEKVTLIRARQILEGNNEFVEKPKQQYNTHFHCKMDEKDKRKVTPWLLEKCLEKQLGSKPKTIRTTSNTTFTAVVHNKEQSDNMKTINNINGIKTEIKVNKTYNTIKGLIYVYGYNMSNFEAYKRGMMEKYGLQDVVEATWIRPRGNNKAKPLLLSFPNELPHYMEVPGEMMKTSVYEYKQRPMLCRKCLDYGHGVKYSEKQQRCAKCGEEQHDRNNCNSDVAHCYHCKLNHEAEHNSCIEHKY